MARCSCGNAACACVIKAAPNSGLSVSGSGSSSRPYVLDTAVGGNPLANIAVQDTPSLDLSLVGSGTPSDKLKISGVARPSMAELRDVVDALPPQTGDVPVWMTDHWEFRPPPTAPAGSVSATSGLIGDGSAGNPLKTNPSSVWGEAAPGWLSSTLWPNGQRDFGLPIYLDSLGKLRAQPTILGKIGAQTRTASVAANTYPMGVTVFGISSAESTGLGWPSGSAAVLTIRREDGNAGADGTCYQLWFQTLASSASIPKIMYRGAQLLSGVDGGWSPWRTILHGAGDTAQISGTASVTFNNATSVSFGLTFPSGLFTNAPRVIGEGRTSTGLFAYAQGNLGPTGVTMAARTHRNIAVTGTYSIDWLASGV